MTTIAFRDGVMAGDSLLTQKHDGIGSVQKVWKFKTGALYGARGDGDDRALRELLMDVTNPDKLPRTKELEDIEAEVDALFVLSNGEVWHVSTGECAQAIKVTAPYHAIGSGFKYALGSMARGGTAVQAVEDAKKHDGHTGGDVQVERLDSCVNPEMSDWYWAGVQMTKEQSKWILWEDVQTGRATKKGWVYSQDNKSLVEIPAPLYRHPADVAEEQRITC